MATLETELKREKLSLGDLNVSQPKLGQPTLTPTEQAFVKKVTALAPTDAKEKAIYLTHVTHRLGILNNRVAKPGATKESVIAPLSGAEADISKQIKSVEGMAKLPNSEKVYSQKVSQQELMIGKFSSMLKMGLDARKVSLSEGEVVKFLTAVPK